MKFEVAVYNQKVADLVAQGESHKQLSDDWAEPHYMEIEADDADTARRRIAARYPAENGYVIQSIEQIDP